ncbi:methionine ABC transporter substrate-binding protein [Klebsiella pneumoniae]|nr:MetQ/NlpA family ABC transporter substrate-binding protein [Klebsiella pneumoniae]SVR00456.1 methionine ABC transporter substrate-binding protein [Klebsiella pneumoniae]
MTTEQFELRKARRWPWLAALAVIILLAIAFWWWRGHTQSQQVVFGSTLKIHYEPAMAGEQRIIEYINQHIAPDYGLKLEAVGVQDPVQADRAVAEGQYAGTIYQHQWWLKQVVDANGFALSTTVPVFQWAFGIYSDRYSSVQALPNGATIVVPDDGANQGQALWLLQRIGLISLDPAVEPRTAKLKNIVGNPHQFVFKELDLLTMPRALNSVDAAIGYVSQFDAGKVPREKGILFPPAPRTFASQLVIGTPYLSQENIVKLKQAFSDPRIYQHQWWLKQVVDANGFALSTTVPVFQWAFGIYSDRYSSVQALPNGATIVVPDDGANQGQALWLLQRIGLISLDPAVEPRTAKLKNIVGNPHQFVFKELDLLTMPRALNSVDAAIGYVSQFDAGKVPREKGILFPPAPRTFASQLVIGTPYLSQENIVKLKQAFSDPRIQTWLKTTDDPLVKDVLVPVSAE